MRIRSYGMLAGLLVVVLMSSTPAQNLRWRTQRVPLSLEVTNSRMIAIEGPSTLVAEIGGKRQPVSVRLIRTQYRCRLGKVVEGRVIDQPPRPILKYQLLPKEGARGYSWTVWSFEPIGGLRVLSSGADENYVAWVDGWDVWFADASRPNDESARLVEYLNAGSLFVGATRVPVGQLVGRDNIVGKDAFNAAINIMSVARNASGGWTVQVAGPKSSAVYTLVSDKSAKLGWRLAE